MRSPVHASPPRPKIAASEKLNCSHVSSSTDGERWRCSERRLDNQAFIETSCLDGTRWREAIARSAAEAASGKRRRAVPTIERLWHTLEKITAASSLPSFSVVSVRLPESSSGKAAISVRASVWAMTRPWCWLMVAKAEIHGAGGSEP